LISWVWRKLIRPLWHKRDPKPEEDEKMSKDQDVGGEVCVEGKVAQANKTSCVLRKGGG